MKTIDYYIQHLELQSRDSVVDAGHRPRWPAVPHTANPPAQPGHSSRKEFRSVLGGRLGREGCQNGLNRGLRVDESRVSSAEERGNRGASHHERQWHDELVRTRNVVHRTVSIRAAICCVTNSMYWTKETAELRIAARKSCLGQGSDAPRLGAAALFPPAKKRRSLAETLSCRPAGRSTPPEREGLGEGRQRDPGARNPPEFRTRQMRIAGGSLPALQRRPSRLEFVAPSPWTAANCATPGLFPSPPSPSPSWRRSPRRRVRPSRRAVAPPPSWR